MRARVRVALLGSVACPLTIGTHVHDTEAMEQAVTLAASVRVATSPNPWVGCVIEAPDGQVFGGATEPPGGAHAEVVALRAAGAARGATAWVTLEPCSHTSGTGPWRRADGGGRPTGGGGARGPRPGCPGGGIERLRAAGIEVEVGVAADLVREQLAPYLKHRSTGRAWVVLDLAASLDGRAAAPDGTSQWITGGAAHADAHQLRAESDAIVVGAGTVRADDPELTVRHVPGRSPLPRGAGHGPAGGQGAPRAPAPG